MLRPATLADVPAIEDLGQRLKRRSPFATWPYDREQALKTIRTCISSKMGFAWVAERRGKIVAVLLGTVQRMWFSSASVASDFMIYAEQPGAGFALINEFLDWAWSRPSVRSVMIGQSSGIDMGDFDALLTKLNFQRVGGLYEISRFD